MAAPNNQANDHEASRFPKSMPGDFLLYSDNSFDTRYEDDFDAEIGALGEGNGAYDSGYYSSPNLESPKVDVLDADKRESSFVWCSHGVQDTRFCTDAAASVKSNHGSTYDGTVNQSTASIEKPAPRNGSGSKRSKRNIAHDLETLSISKSSRSSEDDTGPTPLQTWLRAVHRHESLAYRLEEPAKGRKTAGRQ
jgi:hypothetical protein